MGAETQVTEQMAGKAVRIAIDGTRIIIRCSEEAGVKAAVRLKAIVEQSGTSEGQLRLKNMMKRGANLTCIELRYEDILKVAEEAENHGVLFSVVTSDEEARNIKVGKKIDSSTRCSVYLPANQAAVFSKICQRNNVNTFELKKEDLVIEKDKTAEKQTEDKVQDKDSKQTRDNINSDNFHDEVPERTRVVEGSENPSLNNLHVPKTENLQKTEQDRNGAKPSKNYEMGDMKKQETQTRDLVTMSEDLTEMVRSSYKAPNKKRASIEEQLNVAKEVIEVSEAQRARDLEQQMINQFAAAKAMETAKYNAIELEKTIAENEIINK
jgi:hypothetical protein